MTDCTMNMNSTTRRTGNERTILAGKVLLAAGGILFIAGLLLGVLIPYGFIVCGAGFLILAVGLVTLKKPEYILLLIGL
jgi:hypothetical protein